MDGAGGWLSRAWASTLDILYVFYDFARGNRLMAAIACLLLAAVAFAAMPAMSGRRVAAVVGFGVALVFVVTIASANYRRMMQHKAAFDEESERHSEWLSSGEDRQ